MTRTKRTTTTNNLMMGITEKYTQAKRVCEIWIDKETLTNEEKKERIDETIKRYHEDVQAVSRVLSLLHITCVDREDDDILRAGDYLDKQVNILYNELWLVASDIDGYYEL